MNKKNSYACILILLFGSVYLLTLAPTYLWSDSAKLAIYVQGKFVNFGWGTHGAHTLLGLIFSKLPFGLAYTQNLMSAFFATLGLLFVYLLIFKLTSNHIVSFISAVALGFSQTYWHYAVINESYAIDVFFRALCIWLIFKFNEKGNFIFLYLCIFFFSFSLGNHFAHVTWLPGYLLLIGNKRILKRISIKKIFLSFIAIILGYLPLIISVKCFNDLTWLETIKMLFEVYRGEGVDRFSRFLIELLRYPFYLAYQFPFASFFAGVWGAYLLKKEKLKVFCGLLFCFLITLITALTLVMKQRQFASLLPTYMIFSVCLGVGMDKFFKKLANIRFKNIVVFLIFILPAVTLYRIVPGACKSLGMSLNFVRDLPYRDKFIYYLWPPKNKEYGARNYVDDAFYEAEPNAVIVSDFNPGMALVYAQKVLGKRKDILILDNEIDSIVYNHGLYRKDQAVAICEVIEKYIHSRPVYLADIVESYYFTAELKNFYRLIPQKALIRVRLYEEGGDENLNSR